MVGLMHKEDDDPDNTMRILIATDVHLGYADKDPIRGDDSLTTFEEILQIAKKNNVDFILNGGDLFHDNKPSRRILHGCMTLLRKYCFGDKPCPIEYLSDQAVDFGHTSFPQVNYEDPNLNVAIPFFSVHGNHDDPAGAGNLCTLDLLSSAGLVNFFGRYLSLEKIEVKPVLLKKGTTQLALYGLGSIRDERLHRMFVHNNIQFVRPKEDTGDWFNLFVIHQNRSKHGATNYIPEQFLANFLDLVFWGHEHECLIDPVWNSLQEFFVTQPGSPIATSLSKGETAPKHVGILKIRGKEMKIEKIPLETVRQFYFEELVLQDTSLSPDDPKCEDKVEKYCEEKVEEMLYQSGMERSGNRRQPKEPLIRLRVDYTGGFSTANPIKFGQKFIGRLANPRDILLFTHKPIRSIKDCEEGERVKQVHANIFGDGDEIGRAEELVEEFFKKADKKDQLKLLYVRNMTKAVTEYVEKEENAAIEEIVKCELRNCQKHIYNRITDMKDVTEEKVKGDLEMLSERKRDADDEKEVQEALLKAREKTVVEEVEEPEIISGDEGVSPAPTRGRGRGRGRGAGRGGGRGRGKKGAVVEATSMAAFLSKKSAETLHVISDSDDDFNSKPKGSNSQVGSRLSGSQRSRAPSGRTKRKAAFFDSDDSDDEVVIPKTKRKGR